jgi:NAD(P)-dependent dehydrogenase (short-subunit alcohol dehydrogenase family)
VVATISGAASGIGRAAALELASHGVTVALSDVNADGVAETAKLVEDAGGVAAHARVDVTKEPDVREWIDGVAAQFGRLDFQFNNAGINGPTAKLEDYSAAEFENIIFTNLISVSLCMRCAIPHMRQHGGAIVNTGSTASVTGYANLSGYTAAKHGVMGLTRSAAREYAGDKIRVNCVLPGPTDTPLMHGIEESLNPEDPESMRRAFEETTALKRYASPAEIAALVAFLMSDTAAYITGAAMAIDAGVTAGIG